MKNKTFFTAILQLREVLIEIVFNIFFQLCIFQKEKKEEKWKTKVSAKSRNFAIAVTFNWSCYRFNRINFQSGFLFDGFEIAKLLCPADQFQQQPNNFAAMW